MIPNEDTQFQAHIAALRQRVNGLLTSSDVETADAFDSTLSELRRTIARVAVGAYPNDLLRALWADHSRLMQHRRAKLAASVFSIDAHPLPPPPEHPAAIRSPLMIKLLAKINGERVELTPKEQRELVRRRAAWRRRAELEPPLVLADHPRALPSGEHPLTRSLARLNTLT